MNGFENLPGSFPMFLGLCAAGFLVIGVGAMFKRTWARRELEALRKRYQETDVTDPEYNAVRALYFTALIEAGRSDADPLDVGHGSDGGGAGSDGGGGDGGGGGGD